MTRHSTTAMCSIFFQTGMLPAQREWWPDVLEHCPCVSLPVTYHIYSCLLQSHTTLLSSLISMWAYQLHIIQCFVSVSISHTSSLIPNLWMPLPVMYNTVRCLVSVSISHTFLIIHHLYVSLPIMYNTHESHTTVLSYLITLCYNVSGMIRCSF